MTAYFRVLKYSEVEKSIRYGCDQVLSPIGPDSQANGTKTTVCSDCRDLFGLASGNFAIIGEDITKAAVVEQPLNASCGRDERVIRIPAAQADIADLIGSGRRVQKVWNVNHI